MKNIFSLLILSTLLISCVDKTSEKSVDKTLKTNNLRLIRTKRASLLAKQENLEVDIKRLNTKIQELDTTKRIPLITTLISKKQRFNHYLELQGNVTTKNLLVIYPEFSGTLLSIKVKEGQKVKKGQILAVIDDGGLSQQLVQLEVQTSLAKTTFERQKRLWSQKIGSEIQFLQTKTTYEAQQKAVAHLKQQLEKTIVKAPFSGIIDDVITEQGSVVAAGKSPLFRIVNLNNMYIETEIPEKYLPTVVKNKSVIVNFPILGKTIHAKIRETSNYIDPSNRTFKAKINIPNYQHKIKPNLMVKLKINDYNNPTAVLIPLSIISEDANSKQYIYVVKQKRNNKGIAKKVYIKTGFTQGDVIEITHGLSAGEDIIEEGARSIRDGETVQIINQ